MNAIMHEISVAARSAPRLYFEPLVKLVELIRSLFA